MSAMSRHTYGSVSEARETDRKYNLIKFDIFIKLHLQNIKYNNYCFQN